MPTRLTVPLSLTDRARVREGEPAAEAVTATVARASRAEALGFHRFWLAEHHAVPGIAGATPAVTLAAVGAATDRIRLGLGEVMLANHQPILVAEQVLSLAALYPGRVDLGLGRSLGFSQPVREALQVTSYPGRTFARDVAAVREYLDGEAPVAVQPAATGREPISVFATRRELPVAAELGLPVVVGSGLLRSGRADLEAYRASFQPSERCPRPHVTVTVDVMVAASRERARELLLPEAVAVARQRVTGSLPPLRPVASDGLSALSARERAAAAQYLEQAVYGSAGEVAGELTDIVTGSGAVELLATVSTADREELTAADAALADLAG